MRPKVFVTRRLPQKALDPLNQACDVEIWDHESPPPYELLKEKVKDKVGLLCLLTDQIDAELMDTGADLQVISQCAVGFDNIDINAATEHGILVGNTPGVLTEATADFAFTLLLSAARRVSEAIDYVRAGKWQTWGLTLLMGQEVRGATLGILGFGRIGKAVAKRASGFGLRILYSDSKPQPTAAKALGATLVDLTTLLQESDFLSLHVSLNERTHHMLGDREFNLMKTSAVLINTARGPVVDHEALYNALLHKEIAYAALDVTEPEPLPPTHKLLKLPNLIVVPHIASATVSTRTKMAMIAVNNLIQGINGKPLPFPVNNPG